MLCVLTIIRSFPGVGKMTAVLEMPTDYSKTVVDEIARNEQFKNYKLRVTKGSSVGDNYLGEIFRIVITGEKKSGRNETVSLIMKMAPADPVLRKDSFIQNFYFREVGVYTKMLPELDSLQTLLPDYEKFHYAKLYTAVIEEGNEMLVMEDLSVKGFGMYDRMKPFDYDHLCIFVKNLARFHATSVVLKARRPKKYEELCAMSTKPVDFGDSLDNFMCRNIPSVRKLVANEPYKDRVNKCLDSLMEDLENFFNPDLTAPYNMLCHGDCWSNNFLFQYKGGKVADMRFLDWQVMRNGSPVTDLSYGMFTSTDKEMRAKYYHEMLNLYYKTLSTNVAKMGLDISEYYPELIYRQQLKVYMKYGLLMSFGVLPLTLSNKGETPDLSNLIANNGEEAFFSATCAERMKGVLEDCVKYNII